MPISVKHLAELLPVAGEDTTAPEPSSLTDPLQAVAIEKLRDVNKQFCRETCLACGLHWKSWCGHDAPTWRNIYVLTACPKPVDTPIPSPGYEELYGQEALRLCRDCLLRHSCTSFMGLAWFIPDCKQFKTDN